MPRTPNSSVQTLTLFEILLASRNSWRHGYDLARESELQSGTLYPLLMRLSDQGILESRWETDGDSKRPRHVYRLTAKGAVTVKEQLRGAALPAATLRRSRA